MMRCVPSAAAFGGLLLAAALLAPACSSPPPAPPVLSPSYAVARDGYLRYRLPAGWFDVSADSQAHGSAIWLLRSDYGATITVNEIRIDSVAREEIARRGLVPLAQLIMSLSPQQKGAVLRHPPEEVALNGKRCCVYELAMPSTGDLLRVVLVEAGRKMYAVQALSAAGAPNGTALRDVQMGLVRELQW